VAVRDEPEEVAKRYIYTDPCADKLRDWASGKIGIIIGIACTVAAVQIIGILLSCTFGSRIRDMYDYAI
jgi:hypothetical protein